MSSPQESFQSTATVFVLKYINTETKRFNILIPKELFQIILLFHSHSCAFPSTFPFAFNGILDVRAKHNKPWKNRYFMINHNLLYCANTSLSTKLQRVIHLRHAIIKRPSASSIIFQVINTLLPRRRRKKRRTIKQYFRAHSAEECTKWVSAMEKASKFQIKEIYRLRYRLSDPHSSNSLVIASKHRETNAKYVIKSVNRSKTNKSALKQQMDLLKGINNPCIVQLCELIETSQHLYIVMEQCEGNPLLDQLTLNKQMHFTMSDCCNIMHQIASGVQYMHNMGIVLRNLKPQNILCVNPYNVRQVKIADYGISKAYKRTTNIFMGSNGFSFFAPEILFNKTYDHTADYWNVGIIMYVLLSGAVAFDTDHDAMFGYVELRSKYWKHVPMIAVSLVRRLLHKDPSDRAMCKDILNTEWKVSLSPTIKTLQEANNYYRMIL